MRLFTTEELATLKTYEDNLRTALKAQWCRAMGRRDLEVVHGIYTAATGSNIRLSLNCGACTLDLLSRTAALYFAQLETEADLRRAREMAEETTSDKSAAVSKKKSNTKSKKA